VRKAAEAVPLGSKVKVQTFEGKRSQRHADAWTRRDDQHTRIPEAGVVVTYDAIANIERDHGGMSWATVVGIDLSPVRVILTVFRSRCLWIRASGFSRIVQIS
jgi:hypothetical protein